MSLPSRDSRAANPEDPRILGMGDVGLAIALGGFIALLPAAYAWPSSGDDTFIYMRYVRNVLAGFGWVYNPGEQSYGTTSFLWPLVMTPVAAIFGNTLLVWKLAGLALFALRGAVVFLLCRRLGASMVMAVGLTLFSTMDPHLFRWCASGMENALGLLLFTVLLWAVAEGLGRPAGRAAWAVAGACAGLLPFVRPEYGVFALTIPALATVAQRRITRGVVVYTVVAGVVGCALAGVTVFATGRLLPQTGAAKAIFLDQANPLYGIRQSLKIALSGGAGAFALLALMSWRDGRLWPLRLAAILLPAAALVYLAMANQLVSTRYSSVLCAPALHVAAVLVAARGSLKGWDRLAVRGAAVMQAVCFLGLLWITFPAAQLSEERSIRAVAEDATALLPADSRIALTEIGIFGYYHDGYIIDLVGLVDPETLAWGRENGRPRDVPALEQLLIHRGATHFMETFQRTEQPDGATLRFVLVKEWQVKRSNISQGEISPDTWSLYRLERK